MRKPHPTLILGGIARRLLEIATREAVRLATMMENPLRPPPSPRVDFVVLLMAGWRAVGSWMHGSGQSRVSLPSPSWALGEHEWEQAMACGVNVTHIQRERGERYISAQLSMTRARSRSESVSDPSASLSRSMPSVPGKPRFYFLFPGYLRKRLDLCLLGDVYLRLYHLISCRLRHPATCKGQDCRALRALSKVTSHEF